MSAGKLRAITSHLAAAAPRDTNPITTHVLDTALGRPAAGLNISLEIESDGGGWEALGAAVTNADGRLDTSLVPEGQTLQRKTYRIKFDTGAYFAASGTEAFYPEVTVVFRIASPDQHYHVPLLLSPFGYSTYRGS